MKQTKFRESELRRPEDCPTAWFAVLERALEQADFEKAARAQRQLKRLGVSVKWYRPQQGRKGARDAR